MSTMSGPRATGEQPSLSADVLDEIDAASLEIRARVLDTLARERGKALTTDDVDHAVRTALPEVLSRLATFRFTQGSQRHRSQFVRRFVLASIIAVGLTVGVLIFTQEESATGLASSSVASILTAVAALVGAALGYYFGNEDLPQAELRSRAGTSLEAQLLQELRELEARAAVATQASQETATVSQLITLLVERGYWDTRAAQQFREALRTRNALVHRGTDGSVDPAQIDRAINAVRDLKHQLPAPQTQAPS
jgi:hypothetical protein